MEDLLESLNQAQKAAVTHKNGPLLIVAGAGTGKTTVLTRRYVHLLNGGEAQGSSVRTENLLALTFTDKAAGEMEDRVIKLLPTGTYDFWISTFHGFCQRVLEQHGLEIGLPNQFRLLTPTDAWLLLRNHLDELPLDHYRPLGNPVRFLRGLLQHISRAKDEGVTPEKYLSFVQGAVLDGDSETVLGEKKRLQELSDLYFAYRKILLDEGALDFGDLIMETLRLFQERPNVLERYQKQFRYLMVDEFQDTNWAQYELLKLLAGKARNLTVVGDDDQAIYKFRGASLANILQFRDDFPDAVTVALTENYRSHKEILDTAYHFIKNNNPNRLEVKLKDTGLSKELEAVRGEGGRIEVLWKKSVEEEADAVAERIRELRAKHGTTWNDFAVLVRSNDSADPFVRAFDAQDIPFQFMALRGLYAKPVILDVVSMLSLLDGYREPPALWRVLNLGCYGIARADVSEIMQFAYLKRAYPLWQIVKASVGLADLRAGEGAPLFQVLSENAKTQIRKVVQDIEKLSEMARRESPMKVFQKTLEQSGYLHGLLKLAEREKAEALQFLNAFAERIKRYEAGTNRPTLQGFMEEHRLELESGEEGALEFDPEAGPELVKILTVHAAKGLEFKHVFVVSLVDQRFPTRARSDAIPLPDGLVQERLPEGNVHLEEERRLFYVALTRAKDTLTLTGAARYGGTRDKKGSVFFTEAGVEVPLLQPSGTDGSRQLLPTKERDTLEEQPTSPYPVRRRFSFTQLASFRRCPLQYKFAHIYRIPTEGSGGQVFGQTLHTIFQRIMELHMARSQTEQGSLFGSHPASLAAKNGLQVTQDEAMNIFEDAWRDDWYQSQSDHEKHRATGKKAVMNFWKAYAEKAPDVLEVEKEHTLVLGQHSIKAKIDRVDRLDDGTVAIIDYKTGKAKETVDADDREQLFIYQIALEERGMKVGSMAYVYVNEWVVTQVEPLTGDKRESFIEKITQRMEDVFASDFAATPEPFTCKACPYNSICEFRK